MHVKCANFGRLFASLLLLQTLVPQGADSKPVAGRKSLLGGLALGGLAGAALGHLATNRMQESKNGATLPSGCHKQTLREPDPHDPGRYIETERLVCPPTSNVMQSNPLPINPAYIQPQQVQPQQVQPQQVQQQQSAAQQQSYLFQQPSQFPYPAEHQPSAHFGQLQPQYSAEQHPAQPVPPQSQPQQTPVEQQPTQEAQPPQTDGIKDALLEIKRPIDQPKATQQQQQYEPQNPAVVQTHPVITPVQSPVLAPVQPALLPAQQTNGQPAQPTALHPAVVQAATVGGAPMQPVQSAHPTQPIQSVQPTQGTSQVIILSKKTGFYGKSSADKIVQTNFVLMMVLGFLLIWFQ